MLLRTAAKCCGSKPSGSWHGRLTRSRVEVASFSAWRAELHRSLCMSSSRALRLRARIEWPRVHVFWGDERCVPPDQPESNYRMAREALLDHVPLPPTNIHRIRGEDEPSEAAAAYEELLGDFFGRAETSATTSFDLVLLGMGADGHTASLFPGSAAARETRRWVVATPGPQPDSWRVSLTPVLLNAAEDVTFLVSGANKAERLKDVLEDGTAGPPARAAHPADPRRSALDDR